jgi:DNA-binding NarL/FixJ family response regulator
MKGPSKKARHSDEPCNTSPQTPARSADVLSIVEAAYDVDCPTEQWIQKLLYAADQSVGASLAGFACTFKLNDQGFAIDRASASFVRQTPETVHAIFDGLTRMPPPWLSVHLRDPHTATLCTTTSEVDPNFSLRYRAGLQKDGIFDGINVGCMDLDRHGVLLSIGIGEATTLTPEFRQNLTKVGTHILAGVDGMSLDSAAAVLSADGKLLHATGDATLNDARRALQNAAGCIERARGTSRLDVPAALNLWKGLVASRWTLIDSFDERGIKYIVARENAPQSNELSRLTLTERCVVTYAARGFSNKEIAYTLGISASTVRVLIMRAIRRCALRDRQELLALSRAAEGGG